MRIIDVVVEDDLAGGRMDAILARLIDGCSRTYLQKIIEGGCVTVNDEVEVSKKALLSSGDEIHIELPDPIELQVIPEDIPLEVVYEDAYLLVVNKPQGMVVHPAPGNYTGTLVNALMAHCKDLSTINGIVRPGIVHRIDKDTSGLLMVAKNDLAHHSLAEQLKAHSILRRYQAIAVGVLKEDSGTIVGAIGRNPSNRLQMAIVDRGGKDAVTHFSVKARTEQYTWVELELETGRTHQIRVHLAWRGHPLAGDPVYGTGREKIKHSGQLLHAGTLGFVHPATKKEMIFEAPLPDYFKSFMKKAGFQTGEVEEDGV